MAAASLGEWFEGLGDNRQQMLINDLNNGDEFKFAAKEVGFGNWNNEQELQRLHKYVGKWNKAKQDNCM